MHGNSIFYFFSYLDTVDSHSNEEGACDSACIKIEKPCRGDELGSTSFDAVQAVTRQPVSMVTSSDAGLTMGLSLQPPVKRAK